MTRRIWDGTGELQDGEAYFTLRTGELKGRAYVRARVLHHLSGKWGRTFPVAYRLAAVQETVDNDEWLGSRNGMLVSAICRDVENHLFGL